MASTPQRRPQDSDLQPIIEGLWEGHSLRSICRKLNLHGPSVSIWLHADQSRREQYARACEARAEALQEEAISTSRACAQNAKLDGNKIDPAGARVLVDTIKWAAGRMAPRLADPQNHFHHFPDKTTDEIKAQIAELMEKRSGDGSA